MTDRTAAVISEIDIGRPSRALSVLRFTDHLLIFGCGLGAVGVLPALLRTAFQGLWGEFLMSLAMVAVMCFAAYTGWRNVGVINPRTWTAYTWVFVLLLVGVTLLGLAILGDGVPLEDKLEDVDTWLVGFTMLYVLIVAPPALIAVLALNRSRVGLERVPLGDLLSGLWKRGGIPALQATGVRRVNARRGMAFALAGVAALMAVLFIPLPEDTRVASNVARSLDQLRLLAFFLIIMARRYFQVDADSLLALDKRSPILFLRSFADDEKVKYGNVARAVLDFSLETRLANHFMRFGPFIAIGSPKDTVPQPGAARVLLGDDEWQERVLRWMRDASVIIMYSGTTRWVNWELRQVIEAGRATSLILMFPEARGWRRSRRQRDIEARSVQIREVFRDTPWTEELTEYSDFEGLRAMLFRADGSMVMIRSRSRSRDAYHLAALIAHHEMLAPAFAAGAPYVRPASRRIASMVGAGAVGIAAIATAAFFFAAPDAVDKLTQAQGWQPAAALGGQIAFGQSDIRYDASVSEMNVRRVGAYLQADGFFSDNSPATVLLARDRQAYRMEFVVERPYAGDFWTQVRLATLASDVGREALGGWPVDVSFVDTALAPITTVPRSAVQTYLEGELYYTEPVTAEKAARVGGYLQEVGYFENGRQASVHLGWENGAYQLRYVINPAYADNPATVDYYTTITRRLSEQVLDGTPVIMYLCDGNFHALRELRLM